MYFFASSDGIVSSPDTLRASEISVTFSIVAGSAVSLSAASIAFA